MDRETDITHILAMREHSFEFYELGADYGHVPQNGVITDKKRYMQDELYAASQRQFLREGKYEKGDLE